MKDNTAKVLSITAIWASMACTFAFGVFDSNWVNNEGLFVMLLITLSILGATVWATWFVCNSFTQTENKQPTSSAD